MKPSKQEHASANLHAESRNTSPSICFACCSDAGSLGLGVTSNKL